MKHNIRLQVDMEVSADSYEEALYKATAKIASMRLTPAIRKIHCQHELASNVAFFGAHPCPKPYGDLG